MFARTYHPKASCICSVASFLLWAPWLTAAVPGLDALGSVLMDLTKFLLDLPSHLIQCCFTGMCVPVACVWMGCCWEAHVPWRNPRTKQRGRKEEWNNKITWSKKRGPATTQQGPGQWAAGLRSSMQLWSLPHLSSPSSFSWPDVSNPGTMLPPLLDFLQAYLWLCF